MTIRTLDIAAGGRAVAAVMVGLMVFSSCTSPEPGQSGSGMTASASSAPATPESSPHPFAGDSTWIAYQTSRSGQEGVWLVHPDGTEDHQIAMDVAEQQLLPDWSPDGGRLVFTTRGGSTEPLYEYDLAKDESYQLFECSGSCLGDDDPAYSPDGREVAFVRAFSPFVGEVPSAWSEWHGGASQGCCFIDEWVRSTSFAAKAPPCRRPARCWTNSIWNAGWMILAQCSQGPTLRARLSGPCLETADATFHVS